MIDRTALKISHPVETAFDIVADIPLSDLEDDPYPFYVWMREECPVVYVPETGRVWLMTWELVKAAGTNDAVFGPTIKAHEHVYGRGNVMSLTGAQHRVIRNAANHPVRPKQVNRYYETGIRANAQKYLRDARPRGEADATGDIFEPLSQRVVGDVLGFSDVEDAVLGRWFHALAAYLVDYGRDAAVAEQSRVVKAEIREYLDGRVPQLAANPDHTALSHLLHDGMAEGELRPIEEILPTIGVLIVGGFQEPAHLIASTLYGLLTHPGQAQLLVDDPVRWARPAIEEALRWLSPFGMTEKLTTEDIRIGGVLIPAGTEVAMVIGSANHDPARFERPDEFDIARTDQDNVSFGFGSHFCIGHNVARALGEVVIAETFQTLPNLRLDPGNPPVVHGWLTRAPKSLPVRWDV